MKRFFKGLGKILASALCLSLCIVFLPYVYRAVSQWLPDGSRNAVNVSAILSRHMEESARLETSHVMDEGVVSSSVDALWIGQVQNVVMEYVYEASIGVDLRKIRMHISGNRLTLTLPSREIINDSITVTQVDKDDFWFPLSETRRAELIEAERVKCREHYLSENEETMQADENTMRVLSDYINGLLSEIGKYNVDIQFDTEGE